MIYADKVLTFRVSNDQGTTYEAAVILKKDHGTTSWATTLFTRAQGTTGAPSRWKAVGISARLWPAGSASKRTGYAGTLQGHLSNIGIGAVTITGMWEVALTEQDKDDLNDTRVAGAPVPRHLFGGPQGIEASFNQTAPMTITRTGLNEAAQWLVDGPIMALGNEEPLDAWTVSPLSTAHIVLPPTASAAPASGYTLSNGDPFITRVFRRINGVDINDVEYVKMLFARRKTILLVGPGGTGKTSVIEAASDKLFVSLGNAEMTTLSLYGRFEPDSSEASGFGWFRSELVRSIQYAQANPDEQVTWLLDEAMQVPEEVQINLHPLLDHRRMLVIEEGPDKGILKAPENWSMAAASNPHEPGARLGRPFASRLKVHPYYTNWGVVEQKVGPGYELLLTVARNMELLRRNRLADWAPQIRHIIEVVDDIQFLGLEYGLSSLLNFCDAETGFSGSRDLEELERLITETYQMSNIQRLAFE